MRQCRRCKEPVDKANSHCKNPQCPWCSKCAKPMADTLPGKGKEPPRGHPG